MTQGFHPLLGDGWGCGKGVDCRAGAGPGFRFFLFCLQQIILKIKIFNSIKTNEP